MHTKSFRECFHFQWVRAAIRSQSLAKSKSHPHAWQTQSETYYQKPWIPHPPNVPIYCTQSGIILLEVLNLYYILPSVILPVPQPSIFLICFRTKIIGNTVLPVYLRITSLLSPPNRISLSFCLPRSSFPWNFAVKVYFLFSCVSWFINPINCRWSAEIIETLTR